jgi:4'-phosphopantetheinyl transferase
VRAAADGAPEAFAADVRLPLTISISHSAGRALAAVRAAEEPLGADVERIEPRDPLLVEDFFSPADAAAVALEPPRDRDRMITILWTGKEAALKALRRGLRDDSRGVRVTLLDAKAAAWQRFEVATAGAALAGWWCIDRGFALAIAGTNLEHSPVAMTTSR